MKKAFIFTKTLSLLIVLGFSMISFVSCSKEDADEPFLIWDINPLTVDIILQNAEGENLFCPSTEGNFIGKNIVVEYNNNIYEAQWEFNRYSRALPAFFMGLYIKQGKGEFVPGVGREDDSTKNTLSFGEFERDSNHDISFTLKIEDDPQIYRIDVTNRIKWEKQTPVITTIKKLNDEIVNTDVIYISL